MNCDLPPPSPVANLPLSKSSWTHAPDHGVASVVVHRNDGMRVSTSSSVVATAAVLPGGRCLSSRSGGGKRGRRPTEKGPRSSADAKDGAEKESYTFLEEEDLGRLSSESKVREGVSVDLVLNLWWVLAYLVCTAAQRAKFCEHQRTK